ALAGREDRVRPGKDAGAVGLERVEGAGSSQTLDDALVDGAWADARGKVRKRGEAALPALFHDLLDRLRTDAFQRSERIVDRIVADLEGCAGTIDVGRLDLDAEPLRLGAEFGELVGVVEFERHRRCQKLDRIMR